MRGLAIPAAMLLSVVAVCEAAAQSPVAMKVAYVQSRRLIEEAPGAKEAKLTVEKEEARYRAELTLLQDSVKNMITAYQNGSALLSAAVKQQREDAIRAKQASLEKKVGEYDEKLRARQQELVQPIMDRINTALAEYRRENGLHVILDRDSGVLLAADTTLDVTTRILGRLKAPTPVR